MAHIDVDIERPDTSSVRYRLSPSFRAREYLSENTYKIDYPVDISSVSEGVLAVPAVANLAPVAWITGTTVRVDALDATFWSSLDNIKAGYRRLFPHLEIKGSCEADRIVSRDESTERNPAPAGTDDAGRSAMLFSGGVDSTATYFRKQSESPALITVRKANDTDREEYMRANVERFAETVNTDYHFVETNLRNVLDELLLDAKYEPLLGRNWWVAVQYGLAYMGVCAPLTVRLGCSSLYQSSGFTADPQFPTAQPYIIDEIRWNGTRCRLDGPDVSRQEKIGVIADNIDERTDFDVFSCISGTSGGNCSACEKCYRTILGFLAEGIDPNRVGYHVDETVVGDIQTAYESGTITLSETEVGVYRDIQTAFRNGDPPIDDEFSGWFADVDLDQFEEANDDETPLKLRIWRKLPYPANKLSKGVWQVLQR